jgi:hypothetical protein
LRDEGVAVTATAISDGRERVAFGALDGADVVEIQTAGATLARPTELEALDRLRDRLEVSLAPIVMESTGTVHGRSRTGFRIHELGELDDELERRDIRIDHAVCLVDAVAGTPWEAILALARQPLRKIGGLDVLLPLGTEDASNHRPLAEAILAAATVPRLRLFVDPLQRLDREASLTGGLLDRLSNPEPAFHIVRVLASMLFSGAEAGDWEVVGGEAAEAGLRGVSDGRTVHWLIEEENASVAIRLFGHLEPTDRTKWTDLAAGESLLDVSSGSLPGFVSRQAGRVSLLSMSSTR